MAGFSGDSVVGCEPEAGFDGMPRAEARACDNNDGPVCLWVPFGPELGLDAAIGRLALVFISSAGAAESGALGWA